MFSHEPGARLLAQFLYSAYPYTPKPLHRRNLGRLEVARHSDYGVNDGEVMVVR